MSVSKRGFRHLCLMAAKAVNESLKKNIAPLDGYAALMRLTERVECFSFSLNLQHISENQVKPEKRRCRDSPPRGAMFLLARKCPVRASPSRVGVILCLSGAKTLLRNARQSDGRFI